MYIIKFPLPMKVIITHLLLFILLVSSYSLEAQLVIPEIEIQVSKNNDFVCIHNIKKGETLLDTVNNILSMKVDMVVMRHPAPGAPCWVFVDEIMVE